MTTLRFQILPRALADPSHLNPPMSAKPRFSSCAARACALLALGALSLQVLGQETMPLVHGTSQAGRASGSPSALSHWNPRLLDLGLGGPLRLHGTQAEASVGVGVRRDEQVESARLHLRFTLSPALLPAVSHLKVSFNDQVIQTIVLPKERLGQPQAVDLDIAPAYFADYNRLQFEFIGHYTLECEDLNHTSLWAEISAESTLDLGLRRLPLRSDLALLPTPFFDPRDNRQVNVPVVYGATPSLGELKAAGSVASWLGVLAAYRGNRFQVFENSLPPGSGIVIASNDHRPDFLRELAPVQEPTLSMMAHPDLPGAQLLLVLGKDDAQVQQAAEALALNTAALSGQTVHVTDLKHAQPRKAYDAPRWISSERAVPLGTLVDRPSQLQLHGTQLRDTVRINARMAPDLFTWNAKGIPLHLQYRYTPTPFSDRGALNVALNGQFLKSYPLHASGNSQGKVSALLPLVGDAPGQTRSNMTIPAFMVGGDNQMEFTFQIPPADLGRCPATQPVQLRAALDPESSIDLTGLDHYIAMPNLAAFANSGYPFTTYADLAQTAIVLPDPPTTAAVQTYLTAVARMASSTGYAGTRFMLLSPGQIDQARNRDILVIADGSDNELLRQWKADMPAVLAAGQRSVQPLEHALNQFSELFRMPEGAPTRPGEGATILQGDGPLAAIVGMQSPLTSGRSVIALTATDPDAMRLISRSLNDGAKVEQLHGDLSLLRGDTIESYRINPVYYIGDLPWYKRLWFQLHSHPLLLALLGVLAGLVLTLLVYGALRALARQRLEGRDA